MHWKSFRDHLRITSEVLVLQKHTRHDAFVNLKDWSITVLDFRHEVQEVGWWRHRRMPHVRGALACSRLMRRRRNCVAVGFPSRSGNNPIESSYSFWRKRGRLLLARICAVAF